MFTWGGVTAAIKGAVSREQKKSKEIFIVMETLK